MKNMQGAIADVFFWESIIFLSMLLCFWLLDSLLSVTNLQQIHRLGVLYLLTACLFHVIDSDTAEARGCQAIDNSRGVSSENYEISLDKFSFHIFKMIYYYNYINTIPTTFTIIIKIKTFLNVCTGL